MKSESCVYQPAFDAPQKFTEPVREYFSKGHSLDNNNTKPQIKPNKSEKKKNALNSEFIAKREDSILLVFLILKELIFCAKRKHHGG